MYFLLGCEQPQYDHWLSAVVQVSRRDVLGTPYRALRLHSEISGFAWEWHSTQPGGFDSVVPLQATIGTKDHLLSQS